MKNLFHAGKFLFLDMASTFVFLGVLLASKNIMLATGAGMAFGLGQIGLQVARKRPLDTMQWLSLFLVVTSGTATLLTHDPRFVMFKPTIIYAIVGAVMLKRGWMNRYLPPVALEVAGDLAIIFGYIWSALMFASAILNLVLVAIKLDPVVWGALLTTYGLVSKLALFFIQFATMRIIGGRRRRAQLLGGGVVGVGAAAAG